MKNKRRPGTKKVSILTVHRRHWQTAWPTALFPVADVPATHKTKRKVQSEVTPAHLPAPCF